MSARLGQSIPGVCSNRYHQMKARRAAMQGEKHTVACNLSSLRGESSHKAANGGKSSNVRA
jgi:hypothetical protein